MHEKTREIFKKFEFYKRKTLMKVTPFLMFFGIGYLVYKNKFNPQKIEIDTIRILNKRYHFDNDNLWYFL